MELLPKPFNGFTSDLKTLLTSHGSAADKIAAGLSEFLKRRDQWLLIFIDDMERVGPEELRKIFPVVDRLIELDRCYFIFAIDPKRIAKAFKEDSAHGDETKGYLDKVLDFQMSLPSASKGEALEMIQSRIDQTVCPKLYEVLPSLRDYLPVNPRQADRFLRDADGRERMFLSRFDPNEQNYEGFYLLLILEICFPRAYQNLIVNIPDIDGIRFLVRTGMYGNEGTEDQKYKNFLEAVVNGLDFNQITIAKKLITRIIYLSTNLVIFKEGSPPLNFAWALEGYRKLIRFSARDRLVFLEIWRRRAGKESIELMLREIDAYDNRDLAVREVLKLEIESIGNGFSHAYNIYRNGDDLDTLQLELEMRMTNFINHAESISKRKMQDLDCVIFNHETWDSWIETAQQKLILGLPDKFISALLPVRQKLTKSLAKLLPPEKYHQWAWSGILSIIHMGEGDPKQALEEEFLPIREEILSELTSEFFESLESTQLTDHTLPHWSKGLRLFDLNDPTRWLLDAKDDEQPSLDALVDKASYNTILRENFTILVTEAILAIYENKPNDVQLSHSSARPNIEKHPWLLQKCWKGALNGSLPEKTSSKLLELRIKAIEVETELVERRNVDTSILDVLNGLVYPENTHDGSA